MTGEKISLRQRAVGHRHEPLIDQVEIKFAALDQLKFQPLSEDDLSLKYEKREIEALKADAAQYEKDRRG